LLGGWMVPAALAQETCTVFDSETEEVVPGITLNWDSSFLCENAPENGTYTFTVTVTAVSGSADIGDLVLNHTTPQPGGSGPDATITSVDGLPGTTDVTFTVTGTYELVETDEGRKANLHFHATGTADGQPFNLGINAHLRGEGAVEDGDGDGPPDDVPPESPEDGEGPSEDGDAQGPPEVVVEVQPVDDLGAVGATVEVSLLNGQRVITVMVWLPQGLMIV
ncbi:MAG: hypothetical protein ACRDVM_08410, partial [Acidimicrobiia bacterium]